MMRLIFRVWGVLALSLALGTAWAGNSITGVTYMAADNKLLVRLQMAEAPKELPPGFAVAAPPRVALDFADTSNGLGKTTIPINQPLLRSVSVVQAGTRSRVVLNLERQVGYDVELDGDSVVVTLAGAEAQATTSNNVATRFAESAPAAQAHAIDQIDFRRGVGGEGRVVIDLTDTGVGIDIRRQGKGLVVDFDQTSMPVTLERRLDVTDFGTPVQTVDAYRRGSGVRMVIEPAGSWEYSAYQADRQFIVEVRPGEGKKDEPFAQKGRFVGDKLSLNFQNVDVRSLLQVIADFTGLNIVTSDSVSGNLTLRLKDVPWDQALAIILQARGLDMRRSGNVIWIAPRDELASKEKLELESKQQISELEPLQTESFRLKYQKAVDVQKLLSDEKQKILSKRGSVVLDGRTNTVFVQDTPSKLEEIRKLIDQIDVAVRQVMIDARIVEATDGFTKTLGARLGINNQQATSIGGQQALIGGNLNATQAATGQGKLTGTIGNSTGSSNSSTVDSTNSSTNTGANNTSNGVTSSSSTTNQGVETGTTTVASSSTGTVAQSSGNTSSLSSSQANTGVSAATTTTSVASTLADAFNVALPSLGIGGSAPGALSLVLFGAGANRFLNLELTALQADSKGKIISNPRVITADQTEATIEQGTEIPYQQATSSGATSVAWKKATLSLKVKPQITPDDNVIMDLKVNKDSRGEDTRAGPAINTKQINTQVLVENGGTVVIGGIYEQEQNKTVTKIPLFGDLPMVGIFFRNTQQHDAKAELLIFVTPRILQEGLNW